MSLGQALACRRLAPLALRRRTVGRMRVDHKKKAILSRGELGDIVIGVCSANVLLHGAVPFFLFSWLDSR